MPSCKYRILSSVSTIALSRSTGRLRLACLVGCIPRARSPAPGGEPTMKMTKLLAVAAIAGFAGCGQSNLGGSQIIEEGQPPVVIHSTVEAAQAAREAAGTGVVGDARGTAGTSSNLSYHGGVGGIGVETAPKVYVVWWGSQWACSNNAPTSDPSGEAGIQQSFFNHAGGSLWANSVTQ